MIFYSVIVENWMFAIHLFQNAYPIKCPNGTFNPNTGRKRESECEKCWEGWYCEPSGRPKPVRNLF